MQTCWTISAARQVLAEFSSQHEFPPSLVGSVGFGLRNREPRPQLILQSPRPPEEMPPGCVPQRFREFAVLVEHERIVPAGFFGSLAGTMGYVVDKGRRAFGGRPFRAYPCWPGSAIRADALHKAGTLGCFLKAPGSEQAYALVCEHALMGQHASKPGDLVFSYCVGDGREVELGHISHLGSAYAVPEGFDSALIAVPASIASANVVPGIGALGSEPPDFEAITLGTPVRKFGAASKLTVGLISAVNNIIQTRGEGESVTLLGVMEVEPYYGAPGDDKYTSFCTAGDSGAAVTIAVRESRNVPVLGQLVARATLLERGYVVPIDRVLKVFGMALAS